MTIALSGEVEDKHWSRPSEEVSFYDLKGLAEALLVFLDVEPAFEEARFGPMRDGYCGKILVDGEEVGHMGRIDESVCGSHEIEQDVYLLEMELEPLVANDKTPANFTKISPFPPSLRDLAVLVDEDIPAGAIRDTALRAGGKFLRKAEIFDVYTGKQTPKGKKSVALSLVFQSKERTLTEKVSQKACDGILRKLQTEYGAELR